MGTRPRGSKAEDLKALRARFKLAKRDDLLLLIDNLESRIFELQSRTLDDFVRKMIHDENPDRNR